MKRARLALTAALLLTAPAALAQTGALSTPVERTYDIRDLTSRQGLLTISPNYQVLLEFPELIDEVAANHPGIMQLTVRDNRLYVDALKTTGASDMTVIVNGKALLFRVKIDAQTYTGVRKYTVRAPEPATSRTLPATPPVSPATARTAPKPTPITEPDAHSATPRVIEAPVTRAATSATPELPGWLAVNLQPVLLPNGDLLVHYAIANTGERAVIADPNRLRVLIRDEAGTRPLAFRVSRASSSGVPGTVAPGSSLFGALLIDVTTLSPSGSLTLEWALTPAGSTSSMVYRQALDLASAATAGAR